MKIAIGNEITANSGDLAITSRSVQGPRLQGGPTTLPELAQNAQSSWWGDPAHLC